MIGYHELTRKELLTLPLIALVVANAVPIVGVLWLDWDALVVVVVYWAESLIVAFYSILKCILAPARRVKMIKKLMGVPVFLWFFGWFTSGHVLAIFFFFVIFPQEFLHLPSRTDAVPEGDFLKVSWPGPLGLFELGVDVVRILYYILPRAIILPLCCLMASHGISFVVDYLVKGARHSAKFPQVLVEPFSRVVVLHIAIMIGGFLSLILWPHVTILVCLVIFKCWMDAVLHLRRCRKQQTPTVPRKD
jgi:hypothetical protein